jgi:biotin transport system substrate-specific component
VQNNPAVQTKKVRDIPWVWIRNIFLILLGNLLIVLGGEINVPIQPIPVTLHAFAVLFIGMTYGFRLSCITVVLYVAVILVRFPVADLHIQGGYLIGFICAAGLTGFLMDRGWSRHFFSALVSALLGTSLILCAGWVLLLQSMDAQEAFHVGVRPFLLGAVLKILVLAIGVSYFWRVVEKKTNTSLGPAHQ